MNLNSLNCNISFDDNLIHCQYDFLLNKKVKWSLQLDDILQYKEREINKSFDSEKIEAFWFEVDQGIQKAHNLSQIGIGYVKEVNKEPIELFRVCVREELKLASQSKSYGFTEKIIQSLSDKYNKPYSFKHSVDTKEKNNKLLTSLIWGLLAMAIGIGLAVIKNKY